MFNEIMKPATQYGFTARAASPKSDVCFFAT